MKAGLTYKGKFYPMRFDMGVWADLEDTGVDVVALMDTIKAGQLGGDGMVLMTLMLRAGAEKPEEIQLDWVRRLPPLMRTPLIVGALSAFTEGMKMESSEGEAVDLGLQELEKKAEPGA